MRRFLLYIGYTGTRLRGVQKQPNEETTERPCSVQGQLDAGLKLLNSANTPISHFSSRTDKGVHGLCNTAHVDLCRKGDGVFYAPERITGVVNSYFYKNNVDIRIQKALAVPSGFHARYHAIGRSYLYRLAVLKPEVDPFKTSIIQSFFPVVELDRSYIVRSPFDIESFLSGCQLLEGSHNFATFMGSPSKTSYPVDPNRSIDSIIVTEGRPLLDPIYEPLYENIQLWDIKISARSFLYNQVRRIVGALVGVARGKISLDCIQQMLDNPAPQNWNSRASTVPAMGLYLLKVKYPAEVFEESFFLNRSSEKNQDSVK